MTNTATRYLELDALRGFAVMGILAMNILAFNMPEMAYVNPTVYGGAEGSDLAAWFLAFVLVDGKMRGLFSLLFGASMMLVISGSAAKNENPANVHYSRMAWLALFGLFHYFFIWWGDILFLYAVVGTTAFLFHQWDPARLVKWAIGIYLIGTAIFVVGMGSLFGLEAAATAPGASADTVAEYAEAAEDFSPDLEMIKEEIALFTGSYWGVVTNKFSESWYAPFVNPLILITETLPLMMIGMALLKNGFLLGQSDTVLYRKWAIWGLGIGFLGYGIIALVDYQSGFDPLIVMNGNIAWSMPARLIMTVGYAAALILLIKKMTGSWFIIRVASAGRAAFTNYLGTSLLMTFLFYGWGLGYFGQIGRDESYLFVLAAWAIMLLWSKPWLMRFRYGPLEWLWRTLARREIQPMRISS